MTDLKPIPGAGWSRYKCGTCGDRNLFITPDLFCDDETYWLIRCAKGHELVPVPGTEMRVLSGAAMMVAT